MSLIFLDASFFMALVSPRDELQRLAIRWRKVLRGPFVTTEFVLLELADGLAKHRKVDIATIMIDSLRDDPILEIVPVNSEWIAQGYSLYRQRGDKTWGLTDCISFCLMRERGIFEALTYDRHFEQAGFRAMLRHEPPTNGRH